MFFFEGGGYKPSLNLLGQYQALGDVNAISLSKLEIDTGNKFIIFPHVLDVFPNLINLELPPFLDYDNFFFCLLFSCSESYD